MKFFNKNSGQNTSMMKSMDKNILKQKFYSSLKKI